MILQHYWYHLSMVASARRYYGTPIKGHLGVTKGDLISPTIFNIVVDVVIIYWVMMVVGEEAGRDGFGRTAQWLAVLFYADYGLLALPRTSRLQAALDILAGLFDRVGLQINVNKTVGMVCHPCSIFGVH